MNKNHIALIAVGILCLAIITLISTAKCADNKANVLWPEGKVMPR